MEERTARADEEARLKEEIIRTGVHLLRSGLVWGTGGNISARLPGASYFYITPSGMNYEELTPDDLVAVDYEGEVVQGTRRPSIERLLHAFILRARPEVNAVVHTHSPYATAVASARRRLPAFLETVIAANGYGVEVAEYAPSGTRELAENALRTLGQGRAVLLANHGVVGVGDNLKKALSVCETVERASMIFLFSHLVGGPVPIPDELIAREIEFFRTGYGQR